MLRSQSIGALLSISILASLSAGVANAQPYNADLWITATGFTATGFAAELHRITPTGVRTTLLTSVSFNGREPYGIRMHVDNANLVILESSTRTGGGAVRVWDPARAIPLTRLASLPTQPQLPAVDIAPQSDGDYIVVGGANTWRVRAATGANTFATHPSFFSLTCVAQDLQTGGYLLGDWVNGVLRLAPDGSFVGTHPIRNPTRIENDHETGDLVIAGIKKLLLLDPAGGIRTIYSGPLTPGGLALDRAAGNGRIVVAERSLLRMDINGTVVTSQPLFQFRSATGMCFDRGRNLVVRKVGAPNRYRLFIDAPGVIGDWYAIGLSITGFTPGIPLAGLTVPLTPDAVFVNSIRGLLAPFLSGNLGQLDAVGRGKALLDVSALGTQVSGLRVWAAVAVFDRRTPGRVRLISKPVLIVLE